MKKIENADEMYYELIQMQYPYYQACHLETSKRLNAILGDCVKYLKKNSDYADSSLYRFDVRIFYALYYSRHADKEIRGKILNAIRDLPPEQSNKILEVMAGYGDMDLRLLSLIIEKNEPKLLLLLLCSRINEKKLPKEDFIRAYELFIKHELLDSWYDDFYNKTIFNLKLIIVEGNRINENIEALNYYYKPCNRKKTLQCKEKILEQITKQYKEYTHKNVFQRIFGLK